MTRGFAVFSLAEAFFAFDASVVREILRAAALSPAPGHVGFEGLLNLRGEVVPVIDVRARLGLAAREIAVTDYWIVLDVEGRCGVVRTESSVRLETVDDSAVQPTDAANATISATIRFAHEVASLLRADDLLSGLEVNAR